MAIIKRTAINGVTVTLDTTVAKEYNGHFIVLTKNGEELISGYDFIRDEVDCWSPPEGTIALVRSNKSNDMVHPLGAVTAQLVSDAFAEYDLLDEIKLPRDRAALVSALGDAHDEHDYKREQDYNNDIGFHQSAETELKIEAAVKALTDFDLAHPEFTARLAAEKAAETERNIQSALNA